MTIKQLHYFIAVAEAKSFTHAARNYFIAQTAMSQQISSLEKELGFRLFHRTNRTVELTEGGTILFEKLRPLVLSLENAVQEASAAAGVENHIFRIGLSDQAVNRFLTGALASFAAAEPHVTPLLLSDNHLMLLESLIEGSIDVMLLGKRYYTPRTMLTATELFTYPVLEYVLALPSEHPLAQSDCVNWADLQSLQLIAYSPMRENQQGLQLSALLREHGVTAEIFLSTRQVETALLYVAAGLGACLLPAHTADRYDQAIKMLPMASSLFDTMLLLHHKDAENPLVSEFLTICRKDFQEGPPPLPPRNHR